ncbi:hypothetical protein [Nocardioides bizhenqiangii]|uniref:LppX_LprAFG lipoprotein n=1 Tax=Nocardioides bizhenqiangii TaxID=3095076 RepID=A0ABZ0ZQ16_9ACTN|nr:MULTISPECIES: hypothetical protein [unclassified Nocardioides]MDZ5619560.1 hypothetical protein [Nocardioides sp. HM23]WQQ26424.1 hypothetical protein SHK19_21020 [Nocardioides sp. HM61]
MSARRRRRAALVVVGLVASLTGCGGGDGADGGDGGDGDLPAPPEEARTNEVMDLSTSDALELAAEAMRDLDDVVYEGTLSVWLPDETIEGPGRMTILADDTCEMTLDAPDLGGLTMRVVEGHTFVKGNPRWWSAIGVPASVVPELVGKWLAVPDEQSPIGEDCYHGSLGTAANMDTCFNGVESGEVDGTPARIIQCGATGGGTHKMYISAVGDPVVLRRIGISSDQPFDVTLVDKDTGASIRRPPEGDVIDPGNRTA